jgi:hypothetical protein
MDKSGQIVVAVAGTAVAGPATPTAQNASFAIKAHPDNTGDVWVGNVAGDITSTNAFPLAVGEGIVISVSSLDKVFFDADTSADIICWFML